MEIKMKRRKTEPLSFEDYYVTSVVQVSHQNPWCDHGPSVLFSKHKKNSDEIKSEFYACSAFRDKKHCSFFMKKQDFESSVKTVRSSTKEKKEKIEAFCASCQAGFSTKKDGNSHHGHRIIQSKEQLQRPSRFLKAQDQAKGQAQFHFSQETLDILVSTILDQSPDLILCIGTPSIFEEISSRKIHNGNCSKSSILLMDIDDRLAHFFPRDAFCHYNMFNHHFFDEQSQANFADKVSTSQSLAVITDPPFGGRPELIGATLEAIKSLAKSCKSFWIFWIFPYYNEPQILAAMPELQMCDYQVTYSQMAINYRQGQENSRRKQGSPVRLFTNLPLSQIPLAKLHDYRFCQTCQKFVAQANRHCCECGFCTSKNGGLYRHCHKCQRCVKSSWSHCKKCNRCALLEHPCQLFQQKSQVNPDTS